MSQGMEKTMKTQLLRLIAATALLFGSGGAVLADTVGFNPDPSPVPPDEIFVGDTFSVDIVGDFTDLAGGVIDLGFDSAALRIDSVSIDPYWDFLPDPGGPAAGDVWSGIGFDTFFNDPAVGTFTIATISLTALAAGGSSLWILDTSEYFSATEQLFPILGHATVNEVPVPAAVWLFGSGLLGLIGIARRKKAA
jgi:hypothetical protein